MDANQEIPEEQKQKMKNLQSELEKKAEDMHNLHEEKEATKEKAKNMFAEIQEKANK